MEGDPLVYIVAVLLFYSAGMAALLINYMKKVTHNSMNGLDYGRHVRGCVTLFDGLVSPCKSKCDGESLFAMFDRSMRWVSALDGWEHGAFGAISTCRRRIKYM